MKQLPLLIFFLICIIGYQGASSQAQEPTNSLSITKSGPTTVVSEGTITYRLTVRNSGLSPATGLLITDSLPLSTTLLNTTNGGQEQNGLVVWDNLPDLPPGQSLSVEMTVQAPTWISSTLNSAGRQSPPKHPKILTPDRRIIGGQEAKPGAWPWQVSLVYAYDPNAYTGHFCGGSLIDAEWVLTAGHCVENKPFDTIEIVLGRHLLNSNEGQRIPVGWWFIHPDFDSYFLDADLALIHLAYPAQLSDRVQPVSLVDATRSSLFAPGVMATVTGWGTLSQWGSNYPNALHQVSVPIVTDKICNQAYPDEVSENMLCAGLAEGGKDACQGDSGSALVVPDGGGRYLQAGIVSWGDGCALPEAYGVYTKVSQFYDWVQTIVEKDQIPSNTVINRHYGVTTNEGLTATSQDVVLTTISPPPPNLISSFTLDPPTPQVGQPVIINVVVENIGPGTAEGFYVDFYINPLTSPNGGLDWSQIGSSLRPEQGIEWYVEGLEAGAKINLTSDLNGIGLPPSPSFTKWEGSFITGTTDLYSYADSYDALGNLDGYVVETDETDNRFYQPIDLLALPLKIDKTGPAQAYVNQPFTYTLTITNTSDATLTDVEISDQLPNETVFLQATHDGRLQNEMVQWSLATLTARSSYTVQFTVLAPDNSPRNRANLPDLTTQIVGGEPAVPGAWPHQAALIKATSFSDISCGGSLVDEEWILTAAHCVVNNPAFGAGVASPGAIAVIVGRHDLTSDEGQRLAVRQVIPHPHYTIGPNNEFINDVALLKLATPAELNSRVAVIDLLGADAELTEGTLAMVTGWGNRADDGEDDFPDELHQVLVPIVSNETCATGYNNNITLTDSMVCAGFAEGGKDSCQGDSGGPLVVPHNNQWRLAGVVSFGTGCAQPNFYGIYSRVAYFTEWIEQYTQSVVNFDYQVTATGHLTATGQKVVRTIIDFNPPQEFLIPVEGRTVTADNEVTIIFDHDTFSSEATLTYLARDATDTNIESLKSIGLFYDLTANQKILPGQTYTVIVNYSQTLPLPVGVTEANLGLYWYDGQQWVKEPTSLVDEPANTITATPSQFNSWAVLAEPPVLDQQIYLPLIVRD